MPAQSEAVEAWVRDEMDKLESRRERPDETAWEVETRSSKARREADAAGLASLPPELLQFVWEHSTARDLARLALTNAHWALAVAPARRDFWQKHDEMCVALKSARSFEDMEAASSTLGLRVDRSHELTHIGLRHFRDEERFAELQQQEAASPPYSALRALRFDGINASDAIARLECAKERLVVRERWLIDGGPTPSRYRIGNESALVIATTMRLLPSALMGVCMDILQGWEERVLNQDRSYYRCEEPAALVGSALGHNLHRTLWDGPMLTQLLEKAVEVMTGEDVSEAMVVFDLLQRLPFDQIMCAASSFKPLSEPGNMRFFFELFFCAMDDEQPYFRLGHCNFGYSTPAATLCEVVNARALAELIAITVEEEQQYAQNDDQYYEMGAPDYHELTVLLLRRWVEANNFPESQLPREEEDTFFGILASLPDKVKDSIARDALSWVLGCSRLPAAAKRICNMLA